MKLIALRDLSGKNQAISKGMIFNLPEDKASQLIQAGHAQAYCYWLEKPVNDCQMPCSVSKKGLRGTERECPHFTSFLIKAQAGN